MTAIAPGTVIAWAAENTALAVTALIAAIVLLVLTYIAVSRAAKNLARTARDTVKSLDLVVVGAAGVALAATAGSVQAMWHFLEHDLGIDDPFMRATIVSVLDATGIISAAMAREDRINKPGTIGLNSIAVWVVALLLGFFGANEATTPDGATLRFVVPLVAAWMWDRVIHRDVAREASINKAKVSTITGRTAAAIGRAFTAVGRSIMRTAARLGIALPDESIARIQHKRWTRRFIRRASRAAAARANLERAQSIDDSKKLRAARQLRDRRYDAFNRIVTKGLEIGAVETPADVAAIMRSAALALNASDIIDQAEGESPWKLNRSADTGQASIDRPTDIVDAEVIDRPKPADRNRPTETLRPTDRETADRTGDRSEPAIGRPADRPTPTGRPADAGRTDRELDRPTERIQPTEPADRPTVNIQIAVATVNEQRLIRSIAELIVEHGLTRLPSQSELGRVAEIPKTTVGDILRRWNLPREIDQDVAAAITAAVPNE